MRSPGSISATESGSSRGKDSYGLRVPSSRLRKENKPLRRKVREGRKEGFYTEFTGGTKEVFY